MELGSIEVIKRFVEIGLGIAIVSKVAVISKAQSDKFAVLRVKDLLMRKVGVVRRAGGRPSLAADMFLEFLKADVSENLGE